jgi:hypothetical protein
VGIDDSQLPTPNAQVEPAAEYCRSVEAYLCRKNDGHLVRIVGPAFDQVCGWAARGVPLQVAYRGIDRYFERYYSKGPRRRPVRIEFCEADVLDVFDQWRRAVGISVGAGLQAGPSDAGVDERTRPHESLPAHLERLVTRLTALRAGGERSFDDTIDGLIREIDAARGGARTIRGEARAQLLARLRTLDATLLEAARACCDDETLRQLAAEADAELAPFRGRMPRDAYEQSRQACIDRLIRERSRLPTVTFE